MAYIFQNVRVKKSEIYDFIINKLVAAGWQNISSNIADGDVMYSTGNDGNRQIYLHFLPYSILTDSNTWSMTEARYKEDNIQNKTTGFGNYFSYSIPVEYIPGMDGAQGEFKRDFTKNIMFVSNVANGGSMVIDQSYDVWYYVDKNKIILSIKASRYYAKEQALFLFLGQPDTLYVTCTDSRHTLMAASTFYGYRSNTATNQQAGPYIYLADYPSKNMGSKHDGYCVGIYKTLIPTATPNTEGIYVMLEPYVDISKCGVCSKLDGIYLLPADAKYSYGDIIKVGTSEFFVTGAWNNITGHLSSFSCPIAFQIK